MISKKTGQSEAILFFYSAKLPDAAALWAPLILFVPQLHCFVGSSLSRLRFSDMSVGFVSLLLKPVTTMKGEYLMNVFDCSMSISATLYGKVASQRKGARHASSQKKVKSKIGEKKR
jgi:hypothetical protein